MGVRFVENRIFVEGFKRYGRINARENGGDRRALRDTYILWVRISDMIVDLHPNKAASEEQFDPLNDVWGKSLVLQDVEKTSVVDMVEDTGGKGQYTQWVHCELIVGSETICLAHTQRVNSGHIQKVPTHLPSPNPAGK